MSASNLSIASNSASKPGRPDRELWVLHAAPDWSLEHLEDDAEAVCEALLAAAGDLPGATAFEARSVRAHRWRYARASHPLTVGALGQPDLRLAVCGDWCAGTRVEGAFLSGLAAASRILGQDLGT